jgi:hypothetical protein
MDVYLEIGKTRTFAGAIAWPGWCRAAKTSAERGEEAALQALLDNGPRYARVLHAARVEFEPPADLAELTVVERLEGDSTTDFGAPSIAPSSDTQPVDDAELQRLQTLLKACWQAFDAAIEEATGKELRKGPRGGGRELDGIVQHVLGSDAGYLGALGWKLEKRKAEELSEQLSRTRQAVLDALEAAVQGELPARGPRGGVRWTPRYFVRRLAWHVLDHLWEIEDRAALR